MKLSIIVPIYNKEKYIKECLESIIKGIELNNYGYLKKEDKTSEQFNFALDEKH